jgi:putative membrane protein
MVNLLLKWILGALALLAVTYIVPGFRVVSLPSALVAVLVIGFLNMTLGLILKIVTPGLQIASFGAAFIGAAVLAVVHMIIEAVL